MIPSRAGFSVTNAVATGTVIHIYYFLSKLYTNLLQQNIETVLPLISRICNEVNFMFNKCCIYSKHLNIGFTSTINMCQYWLSQWIRGIYIYPWGERRTSWCIAWTVTFFLWGIELPQNYLIFDFTYYRLCY